MPKLLHNLSISLIVSGLLLSSPAVGLGDLDNQLTQIVRSAGVLSQDIARSAVAAHQNTANGFTVNISAYRNMKANDNDCKIDAVLLAKKIHDKLPHAQDVTVVFYDLSRTAYRSITVRPGDLEVFRSGALGKDKFLQMLTIVKSGAHSSSGSSSSISQQVMDYHIYEGAYKIQRQQMLLSLQDIIQHHGDVTNLWYGFLNLERLVQNGQIDEFVLEHTKLAKQVDEVQNSAYSDFNSEVRRAQSEKTTKDAEILATRGQVHPGPEYLRRERLAQIIKQRKAQGASMDFYAQYLYGEIENQAQNNTPELDQSISKLETLLGLSPLSR